MPYIYHWSDYRSMNEYCLLRLLNIVTQIALCPQLQCKYIVIVTLLWDVPLQSLVHHGSVFNDVNSVSVNSVSILFILFTNIYIYIHLSNHIYLYNLHRFVNFIPPSLTLKSRFIFIFKSINVIVQTCISFIIYVLHLHCCFSHQFSAKPSVDLHS